MRHLVSVLACVASLTSISSPLAAQGEPRRPAQWAIIDAIGYGGLGVGTGALLMWDQEFGSAYAVMAGSGLTGIVAGAIMGRRARADIRAGRPTGAGHRTAVLAGAVFAGAVVGSLAAIPLIEGDASDTPLGSDGTTFAITAVGGSLLGGWYALAHRDDFVASRVSMTPYRAGRGAIGLRARVAF